MTNQTFNFPMIGGDFKSRVSPPYCHIHRYVGAHTHTHMHVFYNMFTSHTSKTSEIPSSPLGVKVGLLQRFPSSTHAALKYLLSKKDAKAHLISWIFLSHEFNIEIKDKK